MSEMFRNISEHVHSMISNMFLIMAINIYNRSETTHGQPAGLFSPALALALFASAAKGTSGIVIESLRSAMGAITSCMVFLTMVIWLVVEQKPL